MGSVCRKHRSQSKSDTSGEDDESTNHSRKATESSDNTDDVSSVSEDVTLDETASEEVDFVEIEVEDNEAFNHAMIQQRQQAIDNQSYRATIDKWQPSTLLELTRLVKGFAKDKPVVDRHWIIYYWIACNIEYDTVSYFAKNYQDQSAESVFQNKKGVCAGYANIYKYLCDQLKLPCEVVGGYSKGYGFDDREGAPTETDHAWNVVNLFYRSYLMESTWGAGHLNDQKVFERQFNPYYFLPRPNELIYNHLPEDKKWQLLRTPIKMAQYMKMPHLRPDYFEMKLEMIQPRNQSFVRLEPNEPYALVIIKAPSKVELIADLKLHDKKVEGGANVVYNKRERRYECYFAPAQIGEHKITIYAKRSSKEIQTYHAVLDLKLDIRHRIKNPISYPQKWKNFYDLGLKIHSPLNTHLIHLNNGEKFAEIHLRTPSDVELVGRLQADKEQEVVCGEQVYHDQRKNIWLCRFAPNANGIFDALILAKRKNDPGTYSSAVLFKINAEQVPSPPYSLPHTYQLFHDLGLKILSPLHQGIIPVRKKPPLVEIRIKTPENVRLLTGLHNSKQEEVPSGSQCYYDDEKAFWRCRFTPNRAEMFEAMIFAQKKSDSGNYSSAVSFKLDVKGRSTAVDTSRPSLQATSLPNTKQLFYDLKLKILSPLNTGKIILAKKALYAEVCIKTPDNVELLGQLLDSDRTPVPDSNEVYYDRQRDIWSCKFAPNHNGHFDAQILGKKKNSDSSMYHLVVSFDIEAQHIPTSPLTFPKTWQSFHDFGLQIEAPRSRSSVVWSDKASYAEILLRAPDDIQLSCQIEYEQSMIENGALAQYDHEKQLWQLLFAPERVGLHELVVYAKRTSDTSTSSDAVVMFNLNVTKLRRPMKFPMTYPAFQTMKCRIYAPLDGELKKNTTMAIHCMIPGAAGVKLSIDSTTLRAQGYVDPVLQREITVGSEEVSIHAKYGQNPHYTTLVKYTVNSAL